MAWLITTAEVCSSAHHPKLFPPSPTSETFNPELPSLRKFMTAPFKRIAIIVRPVAHKSKYRNRQRIGRKKRKRTIA
jgi:hypothetical protein